jgi:hypothetical protein
MALVVAQASRRVTAMVCGGWSPAERQSEAQLRRMDAEQRAPVSQRAFWHWHSRFNWMDELAAMQIPKLVYVGSNDRPRVRGPRGVPRTREALVERGVKVLEFEGLATNHGRGRRSREPAGTSTGRQSRPGQQQSHISLSELPLRTKAIASNQQRIAERRERFAVLDE